MILIGVGACDRASAAAMDNTTKPTAASRQPRSTFHIVVNYKARRQKQNT
jgi:hypothetical protein